MSKKIRIPKKNYILILKNYFTIPVGLKVKAQISNKQKHRVECKLRKTTILYRSTTTEQLQLSFQTFKKLFKIF